jgi:hypothetical protein
MKDNILFIDNIENNATVLIFYIDFCNSTMGVKTMIIQIVKEFTNRNKHLKIYYLSNEERKFNNINTYNKNDYNDMHQLTNILRYHHNIYLIYPHQLSTKISVFNSINNIKHVILIHDLFSLEISDIYSKRHGQNTYTHSTQNINALIQEISKFDIKLFVSKYYSYFNLPFENMVRLKLAYDNNNINNISYKLQKNNMLLYPAQYQLRKNHKILDEVLKKYNLTCNIYCTGNDKIPSYDKKEFLKLKKNKSKYLHFIGHLDKNLYKNILQETDGIIIPSLCEGGIHVILEHINSIKPIAVNCYDSLCANLLELLSLNLYNNIEKQLILFNKYKSTENCILTRELNLQSNKIYTKIEILKLLCKKYIPNLYIFDATNIDSTKKAIEWILNFNYKDSYYIFKKLNKLNIKYSIYPIHSTVSNLLNLPKQLEIKQYFENILNKQPFHILNNLNNTISITNYAELYDIYIKINVHKIHNYKYIDYCKLQNVKDMYKNKRIFIFGNGPSLNKMDLELFKNEYTFCTNKFCLIYDKISWRPTFYHFNDPIIVDDLYNLLEGNLDKLESSIFIDSKFLIKFPYSLKYFVTNEIINPFNTSRSKYPFQENIENGIHGAGSVIGNTIQIASYLGFSEIYLVGCDCNYVIPENITSYGDKIKGSKYNNRYIVSDKDNDPNHFISSYFGKNKYWHDPNKERMIEGHGQCYHGIKKQGKKIYNAGINSKCGVYEEVNYLDVLSNRI